MGAESEHQPTTTEDTSDPIISFGNPFDEIETTINSTSNENNNELENMNQTTDNNTQDNLEDAMSDDFEVTEFEFF